MSRKITWVCDYCGHTEEGKEYPPDGWITDRRKQPLRDYHTEECLRKALTPEELKEYNNSIAMA